MFPVESARTAVSGRREAAGPALSTRGKGVPAAASTLCAHLVRGEPRTGTVLASTRHGCYVLVPGAPGAGLADGGEVLPVLTSDALALPTAVRLAVPSSATPVRLERGQCVVVGQGRIISPGLEVHVVRTVRPARVRRVLGCGTHTPISTAMVRALVGRGPGLTPEGDDELAGHLLVRAATGGHAPDLEAELVRTTALSASLLRAAAQGYAVPEVVAYVDAAVAGDHAAARRLRPAVAAIGHTSGEALLRGIHAALPPSASPPLPVHAGRVAHERTAR